jgi:DNA-binding MarR family transcriptional regulator
MVKDSEYIVEHIYVLPRLLKYFMGSFKPGFDTGLKKNELKAIFVINMKPDQQMKYYAKKIEMKFGSFTYLVDRLEEKGLIIRASLESDKRVNVLKLTDAGKEFSEKIHIEYLKHVSKVLDRLDEDDLEKFKTSIGLMECVLNKLETNEEGK